MGKHETSIYRKVIITFTVILLGVLILVGAVVNRFCMSFIKEQRITYNTQVLVKWSMNSRNFICR